MTTREQVLEVVRTHKERTGYSPTARQIQQEVGLASPSTVHAHLKTLCQEGKLLRREVSERRVFYDVPKV